MTTPAGYRNPALREHEQPPLGVIPEWLWLDLHPRASLTESLTRIAELESAIERFERAGLAPAEVWHAELGVRRLFASYRVVP